MVGYHYSTYPMLQVFPGLCLALSPEIARHYRYGWNDVNEDGYLYQVEVEGPTLIIPDTIDGLKPFDVLDDLDLCAALGRRYSLIIHQDAVDSFATGQHQLIPHATIRVLQPASVQCSSFLALDRVLPSPPLLKPKKTPF